jgi:hypothetical protein
VQARVRAIDRIDIAAAVGAACRTARDAMTDRRRAYSEFALGARVPGNFGGTLLPIYNERTEESSHEAHVDEGEPVVVYREPSAVTYEVY